MSVGNIKRINELCNQILEQSNNSNKNEQLKSLFDAITDELKKNTSIQVAIDNVNQIVTVLLPIDKAKFCKQSQLIEHQLLIVLRDQFIELFFNQDQIDLVTKLSIFFHDLFQNGQLTEKRVQIINNLPLINKICRFFDEVESYANQTKLVEVLNRLILIFQRIQMFRFELQPNLFNSLTNFMKSKHFIDMLSTVPKRMTELNVFQTFLFDTCIEFLYWQPYEKDSMRRQILNSINDLLLQKITHLLSSSTQSEPILRLGCLFSVNVLIVDESHNDKIVDKNFYSLIDHCISILSPNGSQILNKTVLTCLCHLTYDIDLLVHIKNNSHLKDLLLKMCETDDSEISFSSYRILAVIMTEDDIKTLSNANRIVGIFYLYFVSMIDDPVQQTAFHNLLHSLKSLMQHEQIKIEAVRQNLISLLIRCVVEENFHSVNIKQYALEILLELAFLKEAVNLIKQNRDFLKRLEILEKSNETRLERVANHLIWQLKEEKENTILSEKLSSCQFDIMISYSHSDKSISFQICDHLMENGYRVWIDRDQMHGDTMAAMANAIENSEFILICMSEAYKQSPYCQAEAHYAFEKRRKLVPLVMKTKYKPDGWLGIIVSGKIYVDFTKYDFNVAYSMLQSEIKNKRSTETQFTNKVTQVHEPISPTVSQSRNVVTSLPHCLTSWSKDDVYSFLVTNNFASLCPLFNEFDGHLLYQTYFMCQSGRETMFQAMRNELAISCNGSLLTLGTYLRFLEELRKYIPLNSDDQSQLIKSTVCSLM